MSTMLRAAVEKNIMTLEKAINAGPVGNAVAELELAIKSAPNPAVKKALETALKMEKKKTQKPNPLANEIPKLKTLKSQLEVALKTMNEISVYVTSNKGTGSKKKKGK
jgi:hypothetical protein